MDLRKLIDPHGEERGNAARLEPRGPPRALQTQSLKRRTLFWGRDRAGGLAFCLLEVISRQRFFRRVQTSRNEELTPRAHSWREAVRMTL